MAPTKADFSRPPFSTIMFVHICLDSGHQARSVNALGCTTTGRLFKSNKPVGGNLPDNSGRLRSRNDKEIVCIDSCACW